MDKEALMGEKKKLGMIGGMGSVAAAYLFKRIVELTPTTIDQDYIETFIHNNTAVPDRTRGILYDGESPLPELKRSTAILNSFGADYIVIACMTSHHFIPELQRESNARIIDAVEETVNFTKENHPGVKKVGVLASTGAVKLGLFQKRFLSRNMETVILNDSDQQTHFMEPIYEDWGIKAGRVTGSSKKRFLEAVEILRKSGAEVLIAGCSELPLVLRQEELSIPMVDANEILASRAVTLCMGGA
jgi:aspartate racemase